MERYSPTFVTEDSPETINNLSSLCRGYLHDDRDAIDYAPSTPNQESSLMRSRFSDSEGSDNENTVQSTVETTFVKQCTESEDLRDVLSRKNKRRRNRSSQSDYHIKKSRHRKSKRRSEDSDEGGKSSRNKKSRHRSRSRERSKCKKYSHYKNDNLDIEIRIKNESSSAKHRNYAKEENQSERESTTISKLYSKYTNDHHKTLAKFKKSFENKYDVSIDSIVKDILSSKSSSEIKHLLHVDIDIVGRSKHSSKASPNNSSKNLAIYEKCMHCPELFNTCSPPRLCRRCGKPRDLDNHNPPGPNQNPVLMGSNALMQPSKSALYNVSSLMPSSAPYSSYTSLPQSQSMPPVRCMSCLPHGIMPPLSAELMALLPPGPMPFLPPSLNPNSAPVASSHNLCALPYNVPSFSAHIALPSVKGHSLIKAPIPNSQPSHSSSSYNYANAISKNYQQKKLNLVQVKDNSNIVIKVLSDGEDKTDEKVTNVESDSFENTYEQRLVQQESNVLTDLGNKRPDTQSFDYHDTIETSKGRVIPKCRAALLDTPGPPISPSGSQSSRSPSDILKTLVCNKIPRN